MNYILVTKDNFSYIEVLADGDLVKSERDALDLVSACGENGTQNLLLPAAGLPPEFFDLSTGLAGAVMLKLTMYFIHTAILITPEIEGNGRFHELVLEANRRDRQLHFFYEREAAESWLASR